MCHAMAVSIDDVRVVARLARLEFSEKQEELLADELTAVLQYMATLDEVDTEGIAPMTHVRAVAQGVRDDHVKAGIGTDDALRNAPDTYADYFRVPKVLGG